jgi:hypothetical protein
MYFTDEEIETIIRNNCGDPADEQRLVKFIAMNEDRLKYYSANPLKLGVSKQDKQKHHEDAINSYKRIIKAAKEKLNRLYPSTSSGTPSTSSGTPSTDVKSLKN